MRWFFLLLLLAAPAASAKGWTFDVEATDEGFRVVGVEGLNPTLAVDAGAQVVFRFTNHASAAHNLRVGSPIDEGMACCKPPGDSATFTLLVPANLTGEVPYWSDADPTTLRGVLFVGEPLPRVRIVTPLDAADVGSTATVLLEVENFVVEPFPAGNEAVEGRGHVQYFLNGHNASGLTEDLSFAFESLPVGHHLLRAELRHRDGTPLDPPATDEVLVYRSAAEPTTPPSDPLPSSSPEPSSPIPSLAAAGVIGAVALAVALSASRSRRPPR